MGSWIAVCLVVLAIVFMVVARITVCAHKQPKSDLIIGLLNSLSAGSARLPESRVGCVGLGGADNG